MLMTSSANRPLPDVLAAGAESLPANSRKPRRHVSHSVLNLPMRSFGKMLECLQTHMCIQMLHSPSLCMG